MLRVLVLLLLVSLIALVGYGVSKLLRPQGRRRLQVLDEDGRPLEWASPRTRRTLIVGIPALVVLVLLTASVHVVPVGHALVVFNTVTRGFRSAPPGVTFVWPLISVTELYDLRRLEYTMSAATGEGRRANVDDSLWSPTQEGLQVGIDLTVWHHLDPSKVIEIHKGIGPDYEEKIIRPAIRSVIRLVISEYAVMDVYSSKRAGIQDEINRKVKDLIEKDGFVVDELVLRDVRFTDQFAKAIEAKQIAQQSAEQMKYVLEKEQKEAERKVIEASGRARAIETINEALRQNPNYIRYLYVDKLSDKISVIVSDQDTIMDLKGILENRPK
ncbi:MAG TPA: prohibitin family protein [Candidatus Polarisedimenticolia bacterium]|nr:prohibitin family protein [Candidatus Polarisedimenticolia bacterium]